MILAVDDETDLLTLLKDIFSVHPNFDSEVCANSEDALAYCALIKIDVLLMDFRLGKENGVELVSKIRELPNQNKETPVIFYSAFVPEAHQWASDFNLENCYFLEKPKKMEDLFLKVKEVLELRPGVSI